MRTAGLHWIVAALPFAAFAFHWAWVWAAAISLDIPPFAPDTFVRWDSGQYLAIARSGYLAEVCRPGQGLPGDVCGAGAWFPLYSWMMAALGMLGVELEPAGVLLSGAAFLTLLFRVWSRVLDRTRPARALLCLMLVALFPGAIYYDAVFPMSLTALFSVELLIALQARAFGRAALIAAPLAMSYSTAWIVVFVCWLVELVRAEGGLAARLRHPAHLCAASGALGVTVVFLVMGWQSGYYDFYIRAQQSYHYERVPFAAAYLTRLARLLSGPYDLASAIGGQALLVTAFMMALGVRALWRRRTLTSTQVSAIVSSLLLWALPISLGGYNALFRADSLLVVSAFVMPLLSVTELVMFALGALVLFPCMTVLFLIGVLV